MNRRVLAQARSDIFAWSSLGARSRSTILSIPRRLVRIPDNATIDCLCTHIGEIIVRSDRVDFLLTVRRRTDEARRRASRFLSRRQRVLARARFKRARGLCAVIGRRGLRSCIGRNRGCGVRAWPRRRSAGARAVDDRATEEEARAVRCGDRVSRWAGTQLDREARSVRHRDVVLASRIRRRPIVGDDVEQHRGHAHTTVAHTGSVGQRTDDVRPSRSSQPPR